jgi:Nucleotidyl transferase AbiEii toxin, Type IV TA system
MRVLNPTAREKMTDPGGRPYFLWDMDITLDRFEEMLAQSDEATWCYLVAKLMRQAKPDDVFEFVSRGELCARWSGIERHLGRSREFWKWLFGAWESGEAVLGESRVRIDGPHEILVDKLCALLGRSELRDLLDVQGLLESGGDLTRALVEAPTRDSGFSPLTLAWVLRGMPLAEMAAVAGWADEQMRPLDRFRGDLVDRLTLATDPEGEQGE